MSEGGLSILRVVDNASLVKKEKEQENKTLEENQNNPLMLGLTAYIRECWDAARQSKKPIEDIMLRAMRQRNGEYEADKLKQIQDQGGSDVYMMITEVKCRAAESWLRDILLETGTPPWEMQPTPIPDLSPEQTRELEESFSASIMSLIQTTGQAPAPNEMAELKEMVDQDYRF